MGQSTDFDYKELLRYIDPSACSYQEWCAVGMALKHEGLPCSVWDEWSRNDRRYHAGECERKWNTFNEGTSDIVTGGTVYQMAVQGGFKPSYAIEYGWEDEIVNRGVVTSPAWAGRQEIEEPGEWRPGQEVSRYLRALFEPSDIVGFCMQSRLDKNRDEEKYIPRNSGTYTMTAGEVLENIAKYGDDIGAAMGDYDPKAGAWIRFNPLNGQGVGNKNVAEWRYALVESDNLDLAIQNSIIRELELPVAVLLYSGGKSIHAIVRIDAVDEKEYKKRVNYLYKICDRNGLAIDQQNKNASRLSRLPGCTRGDKKQFIIDTNIGKNTWDEWKEFVESVDDDLPETESLAEFWDNLPELAPSLIDGILRQGHKMLIAGPSKAGKSFLQIELCISIAEGRSWLGRKCTKGRVLYVNLELDRASCLHRFKDVYQALNIRPEGLDNIEIWNLRGRSVPMTELTPRLIRRAQKKNYIAIVIDPIYKVITGDENSAEQMAKFCNEFDKICAELNCATIYCHHHSKGAQGGKKSMDRASGSGVFARDPDAQLDMIELNISNDMRKQEENKAICAACRVYLDGSWRWKDELSEDDLLSSKTMLNYCQNTIGDDAKELAKFNRLVDEARNRIARKTAWRLEATLREFPNIEPINVWFDYPAHFLDDTGALGDIQLEENKSFWEQGQEKRKEAAAKKRASKQKKYDMAIENFRFENDGRYPTTDELYKILKEDAEAVGDDPPAKKTVSNSLKSLGYGVDKNTHCIFPLS